jgi:signal transduction histidine kinase
MAEVLRLLRLSLILRLAIAVIAAIASSTLIGNLTPTALLAALGSLALVIVISIALARGNTDARTVNRLLAAAIVVQAIEAAIIGRVFGGGPGRGPRSPEPGAPSNDIAITSSLLLRGAMGNALFIAIPAMLGSWVGGRRSVIAWSAFAVLANLASDLIALAPNWSALRFILGPTLSQAVVVTMLAYFVGSLADKMREEQAQLARANRQLQEQADVREQLATSRERVRLARDLHDTLAHTLAGLIVQLKAIDTLIRKEPEAAQRELARAEAVAKTGLEETRMAISDLRANMVEDLGLSGALQRQVELINQHNDVHATYQRVGEEPALEKDKAETLFRIAQEALNNVERHAQAKNVTVLLTTDDRPQTIGGPPSSAVNPRPRRRVSSRGLSSNGATVTLTIHDDGVGFDLNELESDRFGLRGMRERAELIGAHLRVDSAPGQGTTVIVNLKPTIETARETSQK